MISTFDDARPERQQLIAKTESWQNLAENLGSQVIRLREANERALRWLDLGAPGKAREELIEATKE